MDSIEAGEIVGGLWADLLIANWFNKDHIEYYLNKKLSEEQYRAIVELYNNGNMCDVMSEALRDWLSEVGGSIKKILEDVK